MHQNHVRKIDNCLLDIQWMNLFQLLLCFGRSHLLQCVQSTTISSKTMIVSLTDSDVS